MKKFAVAAAVTVAALSLTACGGTTTTENAAIANDVVLNDTEVLSENLTAVDTFGNETVPALDNAVELNAADAAVVNAAN